MPPASRNAGTAASAAAGPTPRPAGVSSGLGVPGPQQAQGAATAHPRASSRPVQAPKAESASGKPATARTR